MQVGERRVLRRQLAAEVVAPYRPECGRAPLNTPSRHSVHEHAPNRQMQCCIAKASRAHTLYPTWCPLVVPTNETHAARHVSFGAPCRPIFTLSAPLRLLERTAARNATAATHHPHLDRIGSGQTQDRGQRTTPSGSDRIGGNAQHLQVGERRVLRRQLAAEVVVPQLPARSNAPPYTPSRHSVHEHAPNWQMQCCIAKASRAHTLYPTWCPLVVPTPAPHAARHVSFGAPCRPIFTLSAPLSLLERTAARNATAATHNPTWIGSDRGKRTKTAGW